MSDTQSDTPMLRTPLYDLHVSLGARMVPFAGYAMPVQYPTGIVKEHTHTRTQAGLFDVSHMGQVMLTGPEAAAALETWFRSISSIWPRACSAMRYSPTRRAA